MDTLGALPIAGITLATLAIYLTAVRTLRWSRIKALHTAYAKKHGLSTSPPLHRRNAVAPTRAELPMTPVEAQEIIKVGLMYEMPYILTRSLEFALFKVRARASGLGRLLTQVLYAPLPQTYGIPTISDLLCYTSEFKDPKRSGRR